MAAILAVLFFALVIAIDRIFGNVSSVVDAADRDPAGLRPTGRGAVAR